MKKKLEIMYNAYKIIKITDFSDAQYDSCFRHMTEKRRLAVERIRSEADRKRTAAGEMLAREMLSRRCGMNPSEITFARTERGKPYAAGLPVHFSVSHSGERILCAVCDSPVGADIERIRPVRESLIRRVCNDRAGGEYSYVCESGISDEERLRRFFLVWTGKEAYVKYLGTGIASLRDADVFSEKIRGGLTRFFRENYAVSIFSECPAPPEEIY